MKKATRRETRECLLQALYCRSVFGNTFSLQDFLSSYYDERFAHLPDDPYFTEMFSGIILKESQLAAIVHRFAPKFTIEMMPVINLLPIFIASYEMVYLQCDSVPENVSLDEAIELAKKFSDDSARMLVNGVLNSLKDQRESTISELSSGTFTSPGIF